MAARIFVLLSMTSTKLAMLELRSQEQRSDSSDVSRSVTNYLNSCAHESLEYLQEGLRRIAQSWVESRKMHKDLESSEFDAAWAKIKQTGFEHAFEQFATAASKARKLGYYDEATIKEAQVAKFHEVLKKPIEKLDQY